MSFFFSIDYERRPNEFLMISKMKNQRRKQNPELDDQMKKESKIWCLFGSFLFFFNAIQFLSLNVIPI